MNENNNRISYYGIDVNDLESFDTAIDEIAQDPVMTPGEKRKEVLMRILGMVESPT